MIDARQMTRTTRKGGTLARECGGVRPLFRGRREALSAIRAEFAFSLLMCENSCGKSTTNRVAFCSERERKNVDFLFLLLTQESCGERRSRHPWRTRKTVTARSWRAHGASTATKKALARPQTSACRRALWSSIPEAAGFKKSFHLEFKTIPLGLIPTPKRVAALPSYPSGMI